MTADFAGFAQAGKVEMCNTKKLWQEVDKMTGLGTSIMLESEARGVIRSAEVFKAISAGEKIMQFLQNSAAVQRKRLP